MKGRTKKNDTEKIYWRNAERKKSNAGIAVYLVDEIEKAWYMDMPEE